MLTPCNSHTTYPEISISMDRTLIPIIGLSSGSTVMAPWVMNFKEDFGSIHMRLSFHFNWDRSNIFTGNKYLPAITGSSKNYWTYSHFPALLRGCGEVSSSSQNQRQRIGVSAPHQNEL